MNTTDPITCHTAMLEKSLTNVDALASVLKLGIIGTSDQHRNEMANRLARLVTEKFVKQKLDNCEKQVRNMMHGTRYIGVSNWHHDEIIRLWETEYKIAVANRAYTCMKAYSIIAEVVGSDVITKYGVKKIVLAHGKRKQQGY